MTLAFAGGSASALTVIESEADWNALGGVATDDLALRADIVFTAIPAPIDLGSYDFNGNHHSIRLPGGDFAGLFQVRGGTIRELNVDLGQATLVEGAGAIVAGADEPGALYGTVVRCSVMGAQPISEKEIGGIVGRDFGREDSRISACVSRLDIGAASDVGGIAGSGFLGTIEDSQMLGSILQGQTSGGILSNARFTEGSTRILRSVMAGNIAGSNNGGIVGLGTGVTVVQSLTSGSVAAGSENGAIVGNWLASRDGTVDLVLDSYAASTDGASAPLVGKVNYFFFTIEVRVKDSYTVSNTAPVVGTLTGESGGGTLILDGVYGGSAAFGTADASWTVDDSGGYQPDDEALLGTLGTDWSAGVWKATSDGLPQLKGFLDGIWTGYASHELPPMLPPHLSLQVAAGSVTLSWPSFWADWTPQESQDVGANDWLDLSAEVVGDTTKTLSSPISGRGACFYRLAL